MMGWLIDTGVAFAQFALVIPVAFVCLLLMWAFIDVVTCGLGLWRK